MVFTPGPIFANIVLADEINRTPPKTQAALLEAMQEHRVTVQGKTFKLEEPFHVFATQNPIELEGTYPLPEAQLDRFMFNIIMDYLPEDQEVTSRDVDDIGPIASLSTRGQRRGHHRVPAADSPRADRRAGCTLRGEPRALDASWAESAGLHQTVGVVRRQHTRAAAPDSRRKGTRPDGRTF